MSFSYDPEADAVAFWFNDRKADYAEELDHRRNLIYAEDDSVIGLELLSVSKGVDLGGLPHAEELAEHLKRHKIRLLAHPR